MCMDIILMDFYLIGQVAGHAAHSIQVEAILLAKKHGIDAN